MKPTRPPAIRIKTQGRVGRDAKKVADFTRSVLGRAAIELRLGSSQELSVLLCDGPVMRKINFRWRGIDRPTNVLSFPLQDLTPRRRPADAPLGDIVLALPVTRREARSLGLNFNDHLSHLLIHGLLHLLGYDHQNDSDAQVMERKEQRLLAQLQR